MNFKLKTEDNLFMSYEFETIFGLIRMDKDDIIIHSIHNTDKGNGAFKRFMDYVESSKKNIILVDIHFGRLWHHFRHARGYNLHPEFVIKNRVKFETCLIKKAKND